ncbi:MULTISPECIES: hypothetical protein, partial [unclassified Psychrobacter]|uniref:hypothetical protein n=1 Tax=unclassified Psychrobacter TaxID=196806 RepID=UPI001A7EBDD6
LFFRRFEVKNNKFSHSKRLFLTMKRQKRVLSLRADAKIAPYCVANLVKASALSSLCALSGTILAISSAYLRMFNTP